MLRPERMKKLRVVSPIELTQKIVEKMHELCVVHIEKYKQDDIDIGAPLEEAETYAEMQLTTNWLLDVLAIKKTAEQPDKKAFQHSMSFSQRKREVRRLQQEIEALDKQAKAVEGKERVLLEQQKLLEKIAVFDVPLSAYRNCKHLAIVIGHTDQDVRIEQKHVHLQTTQDDRKTLLVATVPKMDETALLQKLSTHHFTPLSLDAVKEYEETPSVVLKKVRALCAATQKEKQRIQDIMKKKAREQKTFLLETHQFLITALEKAEVPLLFGASKHIVLIKGWVPEKKAAKSRQALMALSKAGEIDVQLDTPSHDDDVPIKLENPRVVKSFEALLRIFSLPSYNELDPTIFLAITFPLFFGFILGDIGYGVVTLFLFLMLKRKLPSAAQLLNVMILSAISSIIFGILFGEVFGTEEVFGYKLPHLLSRAHQIEDLLYIAVGIGVMHINLGLVLGFINEKMNHGWLAALFAKASWIVIELGAVVLFLQQQLGLPAAVGYGLLGAGIAGLIKGEGGAGLMELPSLFGNMLSYARLMAVGIASVSLAVVVNDLAGMLFTSGNFVLIAIGVVTLIFGHAINIVLGVFEGFLHPLRLHYVEFFTKFFKGSSTAYTPFGVKDKIRT